jgi:hypothetical protein
MFSNQSMFKHQVMQLKHIVTSALNEETYQNPFSILVIQHRNSRVDFMSEKVIIQQHELILYMYIQPNL